MLKFKFILLLSFGLLLGLVTSGDTHKTVAKAASTSLNEHATFSIVDKLRDLRRGGGGFRGGGFRGGRSRGGRSSWGRSSGSKARGGWFRGRTSSGSWASRSSTGYYAYRSRIFFYNRHSRNYIVARQSYSTSAIVLATLGTIGIFLCCGGFFIVSACKCLCFGSMGRSFGTPADDSESEYEDVQQDNINDDQPVGSGRRPKRNCFIKCLRK